MVGVVSLILTLWKPISSYGSGVFVGILFAAAIFYIWVRTYINAKAAEKAIEEWVEFPALESLLAKADKEDKNTNIQVSSIRSIEREASMFGHCSRWVLR